jgi:hypothetical protein
MRSKSDLIIPETLPGVTRSDKQDFRVYWDGKIWKPLDECPVYWYLSQEGRLGTMPAKMGEGYDPVTYYDAIPLMNTGFNDDLGTAIYEGDVLLVEFLIKGREMIGVVRCNVSEYIVCFVTTKRIYSLLRDHKRKY